MSAKNIRFRSRVTPPRDENGEFVTAAYSEARAAAERYGGLVRYKLVHDCLTLRDLMRGVPPDSIRMFVRGENPEVPDSVLESLTWAERTALVQQALQITITG